MEELTFFSIVRVNDSHHCDHFKQILTPHWNYSLQDVKPKNGVKPLPSDALGQVLKPDLCYITIAKCAA